MNNAITTLVGEEMGLQGVVKWYGTLAAPNGSLYGIPYTARRVSKFNPVDKSMTHIGPDLLGGRHKGKWTRGAISGSGIIYCPPYGDRGILKIDTNTDNVTELNRNLLPERGDGGMWDSCAAALDGCIYFMPHNARRVMKLDPNNNDAMTSVGGDLGHRRGNYTGTVVGIDGCVYGIPRYSSRIIKYDPINGTTSLVGKEADEHFHCSGNGALGRDGYCIYALEKYRVLKIDTINNSHCFVGNIIQSDYANDGWGDAVKGIDGCIYWPPYHAARTLKYDPHTDLTSLVGDDFTSHIYQWHSGALASDGVVYCIPANSNKVLAIDPLREFEVGTERNIQKHPEELGSLFQGIEGQTIERINYGLSLTNFDLAVVKFGQKKVLHVLEKSMKPVHDYCKESNLCPFMLVASQKESALCAINHLLRRDLSLVNECISSLELEGKSMNNKKRAYESDNDDEYDSESDIEFESEYDSE